MVKKKTFISKEDLLGKVDDNAIFSRYINNFKIDKKFSSPFRSDSDPSCVVCMSKAGNVYFKDYGTKETLDGIGFVEKLFRLSFQEAINKIAYDFGICDNNGIVKDYKPITFKGVNKKKKEKFISIGYRDFNKADLEWWAQYGITEQELKDNDVLSVNTAYMNRSSAA